MMIKVAGMARPVRFEDSGLEPLVVGNFLSGVIRRGNLSPKTISQKSGIPPEQLQAILENREPVDKAASKKLGRVFPKLGPVILRMQRERDFFDKFGVLRPASPLRRANIVRAAKQKGLAA